VSSEESSMQQNERLKLQYLKLLFEETSGNPLTRIDREEFEKLFLDKYSEIDVVGINGIRYQLQNCIALPSPYIGITNEGIKEINKLEDKNKESVMTIHSPSIGIGLFVKGASNELGNTTRISQEEDKHNSSWEETIKYVVKNNSTLIFLIIIIVLLIYGYSVGLPLEEIPKIIPSS
jgi:hypothetical protein